MTELSHYLSCRQQA